MENLYWAIPALLISAMVIGWAAETAEIFISQGLALAILAWLQVLPEFAVEALIAWRRDQHLMIANLTGSLRLLVGLGWPLVYATFLLTGKSRSSIKFPIQNCKEVFILLISTIYFGFISVKGSLTIGDSIILIFFYAMYLRLLSKNARSTHSEDPADLPWIGKKIVAFKKPAQKVAAIVGLFGIGGLVLNLSAGPFLDGLELFAAKMGISTFVFIQWVAPFVSEFPEKITAFNWARKANKAPMAFMNIVSSNIVQWTMMAAMLPIIFSISSHGVTPIFFDEFQTKEIILTVVQSLLSVLILMDLEVNFFDAFILFALWLIQFCFPFLREEVVYGYVFFILVEIIILARKGKLFFALQKLREQIKIK